MDHDAGQKAQQLPLAIGFLEAWMDPEYYNRQYIS